MTGGPRPDLTGQILDRRFRVERLLGRGGMGTVWRVQHVESLQELALKTIDPGLAADPEAVDRFLREARAAGALRSRHVTRIVDAQTRLRARRRAAAVPGDGAAGGAHAAGAAGPAGRRPAGRGSARVGREPARARAGGRARARHRSSRPQAEQRLHRTRPRKRRPADREAVRLRHREAAGGRARARLRGRAGDPDGRAARDADVSGAGALARRARAFPATDQWSLGLVAFRALAASSISATSGASRRWCWRSQPNGCRRRPSWRARRIFTPRSTAGSCALARARRPTGFPTSRRRSRRWRPRSATRRWKRWRPTAMRRDRR